jgi:hypothetical protein
LLTLRPAAELGATGKRRAEDQEADDCSSRHHHKIRSVWQNRWNHQRLESPTIPDKE